MLGALQLFPYIWNWQLDDFDYGKINNTDYFKQLKK